MPRNGITFIQVSDAADRLLTAGENPTIERIRLELGCTGSYTTLSKHLKEWRKVKFDDSPLPTEKLTTNVKGSIEELLRQVRETVEEEHKVEKASLMDTIQALESSLTSKNESLLKFETKNNELCEKLNISDQRLSALSLATEQLTQEITDYKKINHELSEKHDTAKKLLQEEEERHRDETRKIALKWEQTCENILSLENKYINNQNHLSINQRHETNVLSQKLTEKMKLIDKLFSENLKQINIIAGKTERIKNLEKKLFALKQDVNVFNQEKRMMNAAVNRITESYRFAHYILYCLCKR